MVLENLRCKSNNSLVLREWARFLRGGVTREKCLPALAVVLGNGANLQNDANYIFVTLLFYESVWYVCTLGAVWSALGSFECIFAKAGLVRRICTKKMRMFGVLELTLVGQFLFVHVHCCARFTWASRFRCKAKVYEPKTAVVVRRKHDCWFLSLVWRDWFRVFALSLYLQGIMRVVFLGC